MSSSEVCAVIYASGEDRLAREVAAAVEEQARLVIRVAGVAAAIRAGRSTDARWLWLLDGRSVPQPGALEALLAASEGAALLVSRVVDSEGRLHPDGAPRHEIYATERSLAAAERHLVQIRDAAPGSVLVDRGATERVGPPRSYLPDPLEMREWSARLLRAAGLGVLVPASVAVRPLPPARRRHLLARLWLLSSGAWTPREKLRDAYALSRDVLAPEHRASGRRGARER